MLAQIPRTGDAAKKVNAVCMYIRANDSSWSLLCEGITSKGFIGRYWANSDDHYIVCLPFSLVKEYEIDINHFISTYDFRYNSLLKYFIGRFLLFSRAEILLDKIEQFFFNKKELLRSERIDVLKIIIELTIDNYSYEISTVQLSTLLYTQKWVFHPDKDRQLRYNRLLLDSLVHSGDLTRNGSGYKLTSQALVTISKYEDDQRMHKQKCPSDIPCHSKSLLR